MLCLWPGQVISKDRYELFGGVNMFYYDRESIKEEFVNVELFEEAEVKENYPFFLIKCKEGEIDHY